MRFSDSRVAKALKKMNFLYLPYKSWRIQVVCKKRIQSVRKFGYQELAEICNQFRNEPIQLFCAFGTLLGIIRDGDFIKNDSDLDMGFIDNNIGLWDIIEAKMKQLGYYKDHQYVTQERIIEQTYHKGYLSIDFFSYRIENKRLYAEVPFHDEKKKYNSNTEYSIMKRYSPQIQSIKTHDFMGYTVMIPENAREYLSMVYGPKWEIPDLGYRYEKENNVANYYCYEER